MKTSRYAEAQIIAILWHAEGGVPVAEICREQYVVLQVACQVWRHGRVHDQPEEDNGRKRTVV